jgi:hypothetical protein
MDIPHTIMSVRKEILALEERLRQAELSPDPKFFEEHLADDAIMISDGKLDFIKEKVVEAHKPGRGQKFLDVQMSDMKILDHGVAAVVTCKGTYHTQDKVFTLNFMRIWVKKGSKWQIIAGTIN